MAMPKAQRIQYGITTMIKRLKKRNKLTPEAFNYLDKSTHELYVLAREDNKKLEEIKKIIERK